ncbi:unnamed protein product [Orchesella dallaii]|uniref:Uncharacterized protein n=1 Tax=Orchesella dallaii TaxID=48710 RepID=A0ABP1QC96_9HEXA
MSSAVTDKSNLNHDSIGGWKNLYTLLNNRFGTMHHPIIKNYEKIRTSTIKIKNKLTYLKRCKKNSVIPSCINIKNNMEPGFLFEDFFEKTRIKLLNKAIHACYFQLKKKDEEIIASLNELQEKYGELSDTIIDYVKTTCDQLNNKCKTTHIKKLDSLLHKSSVGITTKGNTTATINTNSSAAPILNLSQRTLSMEEEKALSNGLNFSIQNHVNNEIMETATSIEHWLSISELPDDIKHDIRRDTKEALIKHATKLKDSTNNNHTKNTSN